MAFLKYSVLAVRVLLWVLLASLVVFVAASGFGIMHERSKVLADAQRDVRDTVEQSREALSIALWQYDAPGLKALLKGMVQTEALVKIEIGDHRGILAEATQTGFSGKPATTWTTPILIPESRKEIGFIRVSESYAAVESRFNNSVDTLLLIELIKVIGLAIILFIIVYRKIARHLHTLAESVSRLRPAEESLRVGIHRRKLGSYRDELDILVDAINRFLTERGEEIGKRTLAETHLRERISEIETTLEALSDGVIALDGKQRIRYANRTASELLGLGGEPLTGRALGTVLAVLDDATGLELPDMCAAVIARRQSVHYRGEVRIRPFLGNEFEAKVSAVPVPDSDEVSMIFVFTDISAEIGKERQIEFQAFHDPLTRLGNRSMLARDLPRDIAAAAVSGQQLAVLCLDLDNFKNINDTLGHMIGDVMLRQLAERLRNVVAAPGWVTRHGGDEFIVVLPRLETIEQALAMAQRLMDDIARPFFIEGHELRITSSIGISLSPDHGDAIGPLVSCADLAMYAAKRQGKNAWRVFEDSLMTRSSQRLAMENGLRVALQEGQLSLVFQPKLHLVSGRVDSVEALLRWHRPQAGMIPPATFIPVAEDSGLINEIGAWVLRESCAAARRMRVALGRDLAVAVNVSPVQFRGGALMSTLESLADTNPDLRGLIEIELTESALSGDIDEVIAKLQAFRRMGLRIAVDDFGTGYSSLAYLKNLPVDVLKVDQAFVRELPHSPQDQAIVGAVVHLSRSFGFEIVAEGVEEETHARLLGGLGCHFIQGYWFARPMSENQLVEFLSSDASRPAWTNSAG